MRVPARMREQAASDSPVLSDFAEPIAVELRRNLAQGVFPQLLYRGRSRIGDDIGFLLVAASELFGR